MKKLVFLIIIALLVASPVFAAVDNVAHSWNFDNTNADSVGGADFVVTGVTYDSTHAVDGSSAVFDANTDTLVAANLSSNIFDDSVDFSISMWANFTAAGSAADDWVLGANVGSAMEPLFGWTGAPENVVGLTKYGVGGSLVNIDSDYTLNDFDHIAMVYLAGSKVVVYVNGVNVGNSTWTLGVTNPSNYLRLVSQGTLRYQADQLCVYTDALTQTDVNELYDGGTGANCAGSPFVVPVPTAHVRVNDSYDAAYLQGLTVTLADGTTNTTDADGIAYFYNKTGQGFNVTDPSGLYFDLLGQTAVENSTTHTSVLGAFVTLHAYDVADTRLSDYNVTSGLQSNQTTSNSLQLILKPNTTNNVHINASGYVSNLLRTVSTSGQDTSTYNLTGLYQSRINITAINATSDAINSFSINFTGSLSGSVDTTTGNVTLDLLEGEHTFVIWDTIYSLANVTLDLDDAAETYQFVLPPPYLNITFFDEQNNTLLTGVNFSVSVIGSTQADNYTAVDGVLTLNSLAADDYTIRYTATNYGVREYYLTFSGVFNITERLYAILDSDSLLLPVTVTDFEGRQLDGAIVHWQRFYTEESAYLTVEMTTTSTSGESNLYYEPNEAWYKPVIYFGSAVNANIPGRRYTTADATNGIILRIDISEDPYESWRPVSAIIANNDITYSSATREFSYTYSDPEGIIDEVCLNVFEQGRRVETLINQTCSSTSSATLIANHQPTNKTVIAKAIIETNTENSVYTAALAIIEAIDANALNIIGSLGIFLAALVIASLALASGAHPAIPIVMGLMGLIVSWIGLSLAIGTTSVIMLIILGIAAIMFMSWRFNR